MPAADGPNTTVADTTDADDVPTLDRMNQRGRRVALAYYESGYAAGWTAGYLAAESDDAARWAEMRRMIQRTAGSPSFAELCERRGEHERAVVSRDLLRGRGIAPVPGTGVGR